MTGQSPQLRPVGVSDFADNAFRLYRRNFWHFVGLIAVIQVPLALVEVIYETFLSPAERIQAVAAALVVIVYPFCRWAPLWPPVAAAAHSEPPRCSGAHLGRG